MTRTTRDRATGHHVCIVVPNGTHRVEPLARAVASRHPNLEIGAIWCGDPHRRPADDVRWWDGVDGGIVALPEHLWHHALLSQLPLDAEWQRALVTVRTLLDRGAAGVTVLWAGAVAVLADFSALWSGAPRWRLVPHLLSTVPADDLVPGARDLATMGRFSTSVASFGADSAEIVAWLLARLVAVDRGRYEGRFDGRSDEPSATRTVGIGRWLDVAAALHSADVCTDEAIGVGKWRWTSEAPALLDVPGYDHEWPWVLDRYQTRASRVDLVGHPHRRRALDSAADQLRGERRALTCPGGLVVDRTVRASVRRAEVGPPSPWLDSAGFRGWLADHYWSELHASRPDLLGAFPEPATTDAQRFVDWTRRAAIDDEMALLVPPLRIDAASTGRFEVVEKLRHDGLNLIGYLRREASLGDVARRLWAALDAASVPVSALPHERTASPLLPAPPATARRVEFETTLAVVNADQFITLEIDHPELIAATERMIGYWFWELEVIPPGMLAILSKVDEIWAGSRFVADAFAAVAAVPVHHVPIPVPPPTSSHRRRDEFGVLAPFGDRFVFMAVFDHFSVTERKNPIGAIEAFRRAFTPGEGPVLVVKSMNGALKWPHHAQVLAAADGRPDIVVWDEHLPRDDHMALIAAADALVSLHRSEGLGLHLAEAMWLGTPTIATRYSGNLDFMDDDCSLLIDAELVPVTGGEGIYPPNGRWADPDLDLAAAAMRRLATDAGLAHRIAVAGRAKMEAQPSIAATGLIVAERLGIGRS